MFQFILQKTIQYKKNIEMRPQNLLLLIRLSKFWILQLIILESFLYPDIKGSFFKLTPMGTIATYKIFHHLK